EPSTHPPPRPPGPAGELPSRTDLPPFVPPAVGRQRSPKVPAPSGSSWLVRSFRLSLGGVDHPDDLFFAQLRYTQLARLRQLRSRVLTRHEVARGARDAPRYATPRLLDEPGHLFPRERGKRPGNDEGLPGKRSFHSPRFRLRQHDSRGPQLL